MLNILIVYASREHPLRVAQRDHLWSFRKYAQGCRCFYVNVGFRPAPRWLSRIPFDLIVFDWLLLAYRPAREWFRGRLQSLLFLRDSAAVKIALPQDEYASMDLLCEFINALDVTYVFSVAPESEWRKIYRTVDPDRVRFVRVLTGYLDDELVRRTERRARQSQARPIDIGYRTVSTVIWGRFNLIKRELAVRFQEAARAHGITTDIQIGAEHFFLGDDWIRFLLRCKYTLGVEGGSSLLDWDGSISAKIFAHLASRPDSSFDDIARACIPKGADGEIHVVAISPRQLEACLTRTCQILVEGEYNGVLKPGEHYIELKRDFSNLPEVLDSVRRDDLRAATVERAFRDVVASGGFTYSSFVKYVLATALGDIRRPGAKRSIDAFSETLLYARCAMRDRFYWLVATAYTSARNVRARSRARRASTGP